MREARVIRRDVSGPRKDFEPHDTEDLDDTVLVDRARADPEAFAALYHRYVQRVFHYLLTYAETPEDAADLTQHAFLRALEVLPLYQHRDLPFSAWLIRIARNAAIDTFRRHRRMLPWDHLPEAGHPLAPEDPEGMALRRESVNQLRLLVAQLPADKQELIYLRFAARLTAGEIAAVVGKSEAAVQRQLSRIIQSLKEQYRETDVQQ